MLTKTRGALATVAALGALAGAALIATPAAHAALRGNPSDQRLASEFLRLLQAEDRVGLDAFLNRALLVQRPDGTWLTKRQYLADPALVESYTVSDVHGTRSGDVRVIRYTVVTRQTVGGEQLSQAPVPRLSTYVKRRGGWQLVAHANFNAPAPTG